MLDFMKANWTKIYRGFMAICMTVIATWVVTTGIKMASNADQRMFSTPEVRLEVERNHAMYPTKQELQRIQDLLGNPVLQKLSDTTYVTREEFNQFMKTANENYFYIRRDINKNSNTNAENKALLISIYDLLDKQNK